LSTVLHALLHLLEASAGIATSPQKQQRPSTTVLFVMQILVIIKKSAYDNRRVEENSITDRAEIITY